MTPPTGEHDEAHTLRIGRVERIRPPFRVFGPDKDRRILAVLLYAPDQCGKSLLLHPVTSPVCAERVRDLIRR